MLAGELVVGVVAAVAVRRDRRGIRRGRGNGAFGLPALHQAAGLRMATVDRLLQVLERLLVLAERAFLLGRAEKRLARALHALLAQVLVRGAVAQQLLGGGIVALCVEELLVLHAGAGGIDLAAGLDVALHAAVGLGSDDVVEELVHLGLGGLRLGGRGFRSGLRGRFFCVRGRLFGRLLCGLFGRLRGSRFLRGRRLFSRRNGRLFGGRRLFRGRRLFGRCRLGRRRRLFRSRRLFRGRWLGRDRLGGLIFRSRRLFRRLLLRRCRRLLCGRFGWWLCFRGLRGSILGGRIIRLEVVQQRVEIVLRRCEPGTGDKGDGRAQSENFFHVRHCYCLFLG